MENGPCSLANKDLPLTKETEKMPMATIPFISSKNNSIIFTSITLEAPTQWMYSNQQRWGDIS